MNMVPKPLSWGRLIAWLVVTLLSMIVVFFVFFIAMEAAFELVQPFPDFLADLIMTICFGTAIGASQWFILRRYAPGTALWIPLTLLGFLLSSPILFSSSGNFGPSIRSRDALWMGVALGALLGLAQCFVFRRNLRQALLWIAISLVSWSAAALAAILLKGLSWQAGPILYWIGFFFSGTVLSVIGMLWLLRTSSQPAEKSPSAEA